MKEELMNIGFVESEYGHMKYVGNGFEISFNPTHEDDLYFWLSADKSADRDDACYSFKGIEKLRQLIKANTEYFL